MSYGHYSEFVFQIECVMFILAWNLVALDAVQQWKRLKRKRKEKAEWASSFQS